MHLIFLLCWALLLLAPLVSEAAGQGSPGPWIAMVWILKDGVENGSGVYLRSGFVLTAAHLVNTSLTMGGELPARICPRRL
jgi:hypothetical protein